MSTFFQALICKSPCFLSVVICFGFQDMVTLEFKAPDIVAAEVAACYPPGARDIAVLDIGAGTGQLAEKVRRQ